MAKFSSTYFVGVKYILAVHTTIFDTRVFKIMNHEITAVPDPEDDAPEVQGLFIHKPAEVRLPSPPLGPARDVVAGLDVLGRQLHVAHVVRHGHTRSLKLLRRLNEAGLPAGALVGLYIMRCILFR